MPAVTNFFSMCRSRIWRRNLRRSAHTAFGQSIPENSETRDRSIWAAIFLEIGRRVGPRIREVFLIFPAQLIPWALLGLGLLVIGYLGYEHGFKPKAWNRSVEEPR